MKLKRVTMTEEETDSLKEKSTEFKFGFFAGFILGREDQLEADQAKVEEAKDVREAD